MENDWIPRREHPPAHYEMCGVAYEDCLDLGDAGLLNGAAGVMKVVRDDSLYVHCRQFVISVENCNGLAFPCCVLTQARAQLCRVAQVEADPRDVEGYVAADLRDGALFPVG